MSSIRAGIFGASGYTGRELVEILSGHEDVDIAFATSQSAAGATLDSLFARAPALPLISPETAPLADADVVFLCLPHGAAAGTAVAALAAGTRVVDLSADFRLESAAEYRQWYGLAHPAPELLASAVYGLTEFVRADLPAAALVANPGCYPTAILLALQPLAAAHGSINYPIIADAKSGVSGAGRTPKQATHFVEVADNFSPYAIGRSHRHLPEMEQTWRRWTQDSPSLVFSPHLLPVPRGILATVYVNLDEGWSLPEIVGLYEEVYAMEPFVRLLPPGQVATLAHANHSNLCVLGLAQAGQTLIVTSAIDNLVKGAAGQAVQNMNVMFGLSETAGLI